MPTASKVYCAAKGCPNTVLKGYCKACRIAKGSKTKEYDRNRGSSTKRGYGKQWRKLRDAFINENPLCNDLFEKHRGLPYMGEEVDHIIPKSQGGTDDWDNLQTLCHSCHSRKTAIENRLGR